MLLPSKGVCNLVTLNVYSFIDNGVLDIQKLIEAQRLNIRAAYRMSTVELELTDWNNTNKEEKIIGASLTGWQDLVGELNMSRQEQERVLLQLWEVGFAACEEIAKDLNDKQPVSFAVIKPEGCTLKEHVRVCDNGVLLLDELLPELTNKEKGRFYPLDIEHSFNNNSINKIYANDIKDAYELTLKNGRKITVSANHPLSVNGEWITAQNLKIGDTLETELNTYNKTTNMPLAFYNDIGNRAIEHDIPTEMTEDLAWLLGAYFANGCLTTGSRIKFHCGYYNVHEKVQRLWKSLFNVKTEINKLTDRNSYVQDFGSAHIRKWLEVNDLHKTSKFDRIPLLIRQSSKNVILSFITGYADNDGCFAADTFSIDTANEIFARHMQEVGETVGLSFGLSINKSRANSFSKKPMYKTNLSRTYSCKESIEYIQKHSVKAQKKPIKWSANQNNIPNPYKIRDIQILENQETYDIEVENIHWYYQGAIKSHNTLSLLPGVSPGVHYAHSPYYIRRVRISANDPLVKVCEELEFPVFNEVGETDENCKTKVIEFPCKSAAKATKYDISAIEQLENYKMFMNYYVDANASVTITVKEDEWEEVEEWIWQNWEEVVAISFLSLSDSFYELMPYEQITKEEYEERKRNMRPFIASLISKYEVEEMELDIGDMSDCSSGMCSIR